MALGEFFRTEGWSRTPPEAIARSVAEHRRSASSASDYRQDRRVGGAGLGAGA